MKNKVKLSLGSFFAGVCNGVFGVGGGILIVPLLEKCDIKPKVAHATSVLVIAVFSVLSFIVYFFKGYFDFYESFWFLPSGVLGSILGGLILKKIRIKLLKRIFGILILISSLRLLFK